MARRYYSSTAVETTLSGAISNSATSITVTALSGFPNTTPWTAILDADTASEELVEVTNVAGTTLTVTRGVDGTAAVSHNAGASFRHGVSARDFDEANDHVNDSTGVHGIGSGSSVVGTTDTQTLTNKTISGANNTVSNIAQASVTDLTTDLAAKAPVANPTFTGVASFPDGSASDPSVTNDGDTNTGLFFPAADTVAVTTGGSERLRVSSAGLVGVGTDSPSEVVHVIGGVRVARHSSDVNARAFTLFKSRGSQSSPSVVQNGDVVGDIQWHAHDGSSYNLTALLRVNVDEAAGAADLPSRVAIYTTPDGSSSVAERMRIDRNGLITGTGTSLGAWTAYTPTLSTWALGSGTASGAYCQIGKTVLFRAVITLAADSTISATTSPSISLPVTAIGGTSGAFTFCARFFDSSLAAYYEAVARLASTTTVVLNTAGTNNVHNATTTTVPFTWATGDALILAGTYQAA